MAASPTTTLLHKPASWFEPLRWPDVFAVAQPIEVDVGCGKGAFLLWAARAEPGRNFLGIDRLLVRLRRVGRKAERAGLTNVRLLRIEAGYAVQYLLPPATVSAFHIYFPDPWPKRRHHERRLFTAEFVTQLDRALVTDGEVHVATDDAEYFTEIQQLMQAAPQFTALPPRVLPVEAATDFERLFVEQGKMIGRSRWQKTTNRRHGRETGVEQRGC